MTSSESESFNFEIIKTSDITQRLGFPTTNMVDNVVFTGTAGGFIDDFLGFGVVPSIQSGILAARSIIYNRNYDKLISPIRKHVLQLHEYRNAISKMDNASFDKLIPFLGLPVIKQLIYNNNFMKAYYGTPFVKVLNYYHNKKNTHQSDA